MSDDRLFASNHAIGRKGYFRNLIVLALIFWGTFYVFNNYVIPDVISATYEVIAKGILIFFSLIYVITLFALVDRRLYDVFGSRDKDGYKNVSAVINLAIFFQLVALYCHYKSPLIPISYDFINLIALILDIIFIVIMFTLGIIKGKISGLSFEEYKQKIKYDNND